MDEELRKYLNSDEKLRQYITHWGPYNREVFIKQVGDYRDATNELAQEYKGQIRKVNISDLEKKTDLQLAKLHKYFIDSL